jgi:hypothetical protein
MIRFLWHVVISVVTSAVGLLIAGAAVPGVRLEPAGFIVAVVIFAAVQGMLGPFIFNLARQYASAVLGGIGLVTTLIALIIASLFDGGLSIDGAVAWVAATVIVWLITALGGWLLGWFLVTRRFGKRRH